MVMIDGDGELRAIEGTVEELSENAATLYATVIQHVIEEGRERGSEDTAYVLTGVLTEASIRTVMDLIEDERARDEIIRACRTIGETGVINEVNYRMAGSEGVMS